MHHLAEKILFVALLAIRIKGYLTILWNIFVYIVYPVIVMQWPKTVGSFLCLNFLGTPGKWSSDPLAAGLENATNFQVEVEQKIKAEEEEGEEQEEAAIVEAKVVQGWHISPPIAVKGQKGNCRSREASKEKMPGIEMDKKFGFNDGRPIFIMCHESFGTIAESWRVAFYERISEKYHVIAFDYRGFGTSDNLVVTENSMVEDVIAVCNYVEKNLDKSSRVFLWGHGFGSGAAAHAASLLTQRAQHSPLAGVILSGTFFNIEDLIKTHKWFFWSGIPFYERLFLDAVQTAGFEFLNNEHILEIAAPVAIIHADDDEMVPFTSAFRLYEESKRRKNGFLRQFYGLIGSRGIGHRGLATAADLDIVLDCFMDKCDSLSNSATHAVGINKNENQLKSRADLLYLETTNDPLKASSSRSSQLSGSWKASLNPMLNKEGEVKGIHFYNELVEKRAKNVEEEVECSIKPIESEF